MPRVLFLHGMFASPQCYKEYNAELFDTFKREGWECVFLTSPRVCQDPAPEMLKQMYPNLEQTDMREWINSSKNEDGTKTYAGLTECLELLQKFLQEQPAFDIIMGHSNGAVIASILALMLESSSDWLPPTKAFRGVVICNGPDAYDTEISLQERVEKHGPIKNVKSLHVWGGETDFTWEGQQRLQKVHHPSGTILQHSKGHLLPTKDQKFYDDMLDWMNKNTIVNT